jgi:2-amino-4-hydroxy-6-hydroxymethyldihydropteridine diphosphokinase
MQTSYILLGSNLGDKVSNLQQACELTDRRAGTISKRSSLYLTESWGFKTSDTFINQVVEIKTNEPPEQLLAILLAIENELGRKRNGTGEFESRIIDLDLLFYENIVLRSVGLVLPHPLLHKRKFVLIPMNELAPQWVHPVFGKTIAQLLDECDDHLKVMNVELQVK